MSGFAVKFSALTRLMCASCALWIWAGMAGLYMLPRVGGASGRADMAHSRVIILFERLSRHSYYLVLLTCDIL